ncbi:NUDIX hydrolase [Streptomyces sp. H39-S7]|uniref:NUDIX hydrolase n=1 Tax=Streptomyces sp. H39-S7 TaxID=3004357 RepID=UPI0022AF484B|nr:NUDIX domain-containing protein [Streptomyces sp. H39-S7]MCZ4125922.1 NUDIX domain-containing protein [Streptomyces sp. H39-S7]
MPWQRGIVVPRFLVDVEPARETDRTTAPSLPSTTSPDLTPPGIMEPQPAQPVIDTHVILRDGDKLLLSRRGSPYGYGRWHMPSGKLDPGESLKVGAARELSEETGVVVDPHHLRLVHVVHHRQADAGTRIGFFFVATEWRGIPVNREPAKCLGLQWFSVQELPEDIIEYPHAGLLGYLKGDGGLTEHGWASPTASPTPSP